MLNRFDTGSDQSFSVFAIVEIAAKNSEEGSGAVCLGADSLISGFT